MKLGEKVYRIVGSERYLGKVVECPRVSRGLGGIEHYFWIKWDYSSEAQAYRLGMDNSHIKRCLSKQRNLPAWW